jgi:hypothetical protein
MGAFNYTNVLTATTTVVKSGSGHLKRIVINKPVALGVITIYDNTAASGTKIATITHAASLLTGELSIEYDVRFTTGLTIVTSSTDDITIVWK